ncbi:concanavalin A-like lectin/glucanase domain-containing protein [Mycena sanguinolenta]|nr:concanavalin A-like lectin/glucanase domain-containing protein [Mycena sanguinolenta]
MGDLRRLQSHFSYKNVRLGIDREPLCLVFSEDFNSGDDAAVFGRVRWILLAPFLARSLGIRRKPTPSPYRTRSSNNSFLLNGNLYIVPTLTNDSQPYADGTTYNSTDCTFNLTAPDGGFVDGEFDYGGYFTRARAPPTPPPARSSTPSTLSLWPAIWLLPVNDTYGAWPASGEINMGSLNRGPTVSLNAVSMTYSWWEDRCTPFSDGFRTYTLEWTDSWLQVSLDTRLHTLLDNPFSKGRFWKRRTFRRR